MTTTRKHSRAKVGLLALGFVTLVMVALVWWALPHRLEPDEIVREPGLYLSPGGEQRLIVSHAEDGTTYVATERTGNWWDHMARIWSRFRGDRGPRGSEVGPGLPWLACFDEFDRFWLLTSRGVPKGLPKQSVMVQGFYFQQGTLVQGTSLVQFAADWKGVPPRFFQEIPRKDDPAAWDDDLPPAAPPQLTVTERSAVSAIGP